LEELIESQTNEFLKKEQELIDYKIKYNIRFQGEKEEEKKEKEENKDEKLGVLA
jgi:hypothetical protein